MIKSGQNISPVLKVKNINDCVTQMYPTFNPQTANMFTSDKSGTLFSSSKITVFNED